MLYLHLFSSFFHFRLYSTSRISDIAVPLFILLFFIYSYSIIDFVIGKDASQRHGYIALIIIFYPIILPFYWVLMWLIDKRIKYKMLHQQEK